MPFYISAVDPRITPGSEIMLSPAPTVVQYPGTLNGEQIETPDGRLVVQQPTNDARVRAWIWKNYPGFLTSYEKQYELLQGFRSRYRQEAGLSPLVFVKDTITKKLRRRVAQTYTVSGSGSSSTVLDVTTTLTAVSDGVVEVISATGGGTGTGAFQLRSIQSMTSTTLTVGTPFVTIPTGAKIRVTGWIDDWFQARVLDVNRVTDDNTGNVRYATTTLSFVIQDTTYNDIG
jgi:hypothetical protein